MNPARKPRLLIFIVAYEAESTIVQVLERIPPLDGFEVEVLMIDDGSCDRTFGLSEARRRVGGLPYTLTVLANPVNQGYGGNQKLGYHYAIRQGFDIVALLHGDGQYAPEMLPEMVAPIAEGRADVVLGSRFIRRAGALKGGMPLYKFVGNRILTWYQNLVLGSSLSEFHTGYKAYSVDALRRIPFECNSNVFHFDTEIIIQFLRARCRIAEVGIPTHYGDEICRVDGFRYAKDVVIASTIARLQDWSLLYRRNFDVADPDRDERHRRAKLDFDSTLTRALAEIPPGSVVMDLGCGSGALAAALKAKACRVIGVDRDSPADAGVFDEFHAADLDQGFPARSLADVDVVLVLDVIEHLRSPERFCAELRRRAQANPELKVVFSTANVAFIVIRLMLLMGQFNYGRRGILDLTHTRLFTFRSMRRLLSETGFSVEKEMAVPAPAPMVLRSPRWARIVMAGQRALMRLSPSLFGYQILFVARPLPDVDSLLARTEESSRRHAAAAPLST